MITIGLNLLASIVIIVLLVKISNGIITGNKVKDQESELYLIKLKQNNNWFYFILDSGATQSVISEAILDYLTYETIDGKTSVYGIDGIKNMSNLIKAKFTYNKAQYEETFMVMNSDVFAQVNKDAKKTNIIGILGLSFLEKYQGIINFKTKTITL